MGDRLLRLSRVRCPNSQVGQLGREVAVVRGGILLGLLNRFAEPIGLPVDPAEVGEGVTVDGRVREWDR
jgi:hypothetical protein